MVYRVCVHALNFSRVIYAYLDISFVSCSISNAYCLLSHRNIMNNKLFYQHPNLMRALGMHETVMEVMVNVLGGGGDSKVPYFPVYCIRALSCIYTECLKLIFLERIRLCHWNWCKGKQTFFPHRKFDSHKWWPVAAASCATSAGSVVRTSVPCLTISHTCCRTVALDSVCGFVKLNWHSIFVLLLGLFTPMITITIILILWEQGNPQHSYNNITTLRKDFIEITFRIIVSS